MIDEERYNKMEEKLDTVVIGQVELKTEVTNLILRFDEHDDADRKREERLNRVESKVDKMEEPVGWIIKFRNKFLWIVLVGLGGWMANEIVDLLAKTAATAVKPLIGG